MGTPLSKPIFQLPELKDRIIQNSDFLRPLFGVIASEKEDAKSISLDVGSSESQLHIQLPNEHQAILELRYVVDSDSDAKNGRIYVTDRFEFDPRDKSWESLNYSREVRAVSGNSFWNLLSQKIKAASSPSSPLLQKFFNKVIVPIELPEAEVEKEKEIIPDKAKKPDWIVSEILKKSRKGRHKLPPLPVTFNLSPDYYKKSPLLGGQANLLTRQNRMASVLPLKAAEDLWLESIRDPSAFFPFLVGASFFRLGRMATFGLTSSLVTSELGIGSGLLARFFSSIVGISMEASGFEAAERIRQGRDFKNFSEGAFENFKMFSVFHASGECLKRINPSPTFMHLGSWGTLHAMNEWQRSAGLHPIEGDYPTRLLLDGAFYLHAAASGAVVGEMWGPEHPLFFLPRGLRKQRSPAPNREEEFSLLERGAVTDIIEISPVPPPETRLFLRSPGGRVALKAEAVGERKWCLGGLDREIQITLDERGRWIIQDLRGATSNDQDPVPMDQALRVNTNLVRPGDVIYLREGTQISMGGDVYLFVVQEPSFFEREFYGQSHSFKSDWWSRVVGASDFQDLRRILGEIGIQGADSEAQRLENCLSGKARVDSLSPLLQSKVLELMERTNRIIVPHLPQGFSTLLAETHPAYAGNFAEQRYHIYRAALYFRNEVQNAKSLEQIIHAARNIPLQDLENTSLQTILSLLERYQRGEVKLADMPRDFGLRQKLADIEEFKFYRQHEEGGLRPYYGQDASFERNCKDLDTSQAALLFRLKSIAPVKGSAKKYSYADLENLLHEVLERGKPLETIPTEKSVRESMKTYMEQVIDAAVRLFPHEWYASFDRNYFTGENFGNSSQTEQYLQTRYRFARMLLNEKRGLPIFGEPTEREKGTLVWFVKNKLKFQGDVHFAEAQWAIRDQLQNFTPEIQEGLRSANQEERALVMETYFGTQQHRMMSDPYKAFEVARFLGEVGFYREVGVTLEIVGRRVFTNLSLGDLGSVHPEKSHQFFVLHTHPEKYVNHQGELMGAVEHYGRTMALDVGGMSKDTRNVLFSHQDVRLFVSHAREIFSLAEREANVDLSIFYDRQNRIFKNWVQHPYGMAEMRVYLSPMGLPQKVEIQYGVKSQAQGNHTHISQANALKAMQGELKIPIEVDEVNIDLLQTRLPYAGR